MSEIDCDEIDIKIIRALQKDARTPFKEIADKCKVSTETIKNRFKIMRKKGIILGTTILIDPKKLERKHIIIIGIQITQPYSAQVINMVNKIPGICVVTRSMGRYDIETVAIQKDIEEIGTTKDMIGDFPQVKNVDIDILVDNPLLCPKNFEFE